MIIEPKVKGFICTTAHPIGCEENVKRQIAYVKKQGMINGAKKVLIIGASTGYGLASRIVAAFGYGADTLGIMFEKESNGKRTATAGWYNTKAFEKYAAKEGHYAKTLNGDAFSEEMKKLTAETIKKDLKTVDLVIYSLAAPRRTDKDGISYTSVLKTTQDVFTNKSLDLRTNEISEVSIEPATEEEINATVKVMGGEDWKEWIEVLSREGVLSENAITIAYSYIGPELTYPIYHEGTIGRAKKHLYETSLDMNQTFKDKNIKAYIAVNKALVTQASAAIPIVPLYISLLYKVMKEKGIHEGCIEQMDRLFREKLSKEEPETDELGRIRVDDLEMRKDVQKQIEDYWKLVDTEHIKQYADIDGYWEDFYHMFGFHFDTVDYLAQVEP